MLSIPKYGWTNVTIEEFEGVASYLTDVPIDCLISFINALENNDIPASIFFDEEGSYFTVVSRMYETYIIVEREEQPELITINKSTISLAKELIYDIESNLEEWVLWFNYYDEYAEDCEANLN
ncbi:MAG: hypothetical protein IJH34_07570, partial [Romboutsia sp.]|nr:hypothetical protein [Romboutsia sp.]